LQIKAGITNVSFRKITIDAKMSSDPYYVLGVDRQATFPEIKK